MCIAKINGYFSNFMRMSYDKIDSFLIVPNQQSTNEALFYNLSKATHHNSECFVIIPYQNPQVNAINPTFFKVSNKKNIQLVANPIETSNIRLTAKTSKQDYLNKIIELKKQIAYGNIYEINFCIEFYAEDVLINPIDVFVKLQKTSKAPYAALVKLTDEYIICASPELFLKKEGNIISTKPIKGTIRRGKNLEEDAALKHGLQTSLKEQTENVMAVDVARNDLSKFAERGSVKVNKLYNIETFETVHQMVSTVSCTIHDKINFSEILQATFPMASMTGAPKLKAMTLIDKLENFNRKYYSGAMGLIENTGNFTLSVIIRSIFWNQNTKRISVAVGGAITYLSDPEKEYEECLLKAQTMLHALNATIHV